MAEWLQSLHPLLQALLGGGFTWGVTALGATSALVGRSLNRQFLDGTLGFAAGVMIAASYWSLLAPALALAEGGQLPAWLPVAVGFLAGGLFLRGVDLVLPHLHWSAPTTAAEGLATSWRRTTLLVAAITLHNVPEGMAVGVAFGAAAADLPDATINGAIALALGIGIQNFPEAIAVAIPLRSAGLSRRKSLWYGQLSGLVEPVASVIGAAAVLAVQAILPYALAFAAGAMIFVVVEDLIPEAQCRGHADSATVGAMLGFVTMMILDVALG